MNNSLENRRMYLMSVHDMKYITLGEVERWTENGAETKVNAEGFLEIYTPMSTIPEIYDFEVRNVE